MPGSFVIRKLAAGSKDRILRRRVLITGAAGRIGSYLAAKISKEHSLRLMVRGNEAGVRKISRYGEVVEAELADLGG